ncbi:hypothetical protein JXJ21_18625 [candidate division KSB1 bacterium]|nr:hypothetical protein [candidate division KSB1 bacterium]
MITGYENYKSAIEFGSPEYLPCTLDVNFDWLIEKDEAKSERIRELQAQFPDDLLGGLDVAIYDIGSNILNGAKHWTDEWGTGWADDGHGAKTEFYPLAGGYDLMAKKSFPNPFEPGRFQKADLRLRSRANKYARACVWFTLFERLWMLRGFENMLMDPFLFPKEWSRLRDSIVEFNLCIIDQWVQRGVHGIFFSDDWGSQNGLLIHPDDWRRLYKPAYKLMFDRVRSGGAHVWMHLCGDITAILPDLIDIGLNVLNPVQPQAMDISCLADAFGGKVCFNGGVDVQGTMIFGTPQAVEREIHQLVELFGHYNGGYIGGTSHSIMPETPLDNVIALYQTFLSYARN